MDSTVPTTTKQSFLHRYNVLLKLHYFLFFSGFGILIPVLNITLRSRGLSNSELSYINTIIPFVVFFTNPLCGFIADRSRRYKLTFNVILTLVILLFGTIFLLPKIESEQIHAKLINVPKQGPMLDFCASQELATKCASRSTCGCTYHAHCRTIDASNELQHFTLDFSMDAEEKFTKSLDPIDAVGELTCGVEYRVAINEKSLGEYARSNRTVHCEISCSEADLCRGSRSPNQMNFILLYSLLFILGNILFANAITVGSSLGFASLADPSIFGQQRLWGTIGFGLSALGVSRVFSYVGSEYVYIIMFVVTSALCILFTSFIRIQPKKTPVKQIETNEDPSMTKEKSPSGVAALIPLLKKLDVFIFLSLAFLWGTSYAVLDPYLYLYLDEVKPCRSRSIIGYMSATSATAEFIALFLAGKILKSVGTNKASILILTAFGIRFGGYYLIREPIFWTFMETMHFFNFGILLVLIAQEADEMAPPGLSGTLQGVALGVCFGLGRGIGLLISSVIYNIIGQRTLFFTFSILNLSAALLYSLYFFICHRKKPSTSSSAKKNITLESEKNRNEQPLLVHS